MKKNTGTLKMCPNGHTFYKSSDCPVCPTCEQLRKPASGFLSKLNAPARRALENAGITSLSQLAQHTEKDILALHGMGPSSLPILKKSLKEKGFTFK